MKTRLPASFEVSGRRARWVWQYRTFTDGSTELAPVPSGAIIDHGDHETLVKWADYPGAPAGRCTTLVSLAPLTVVEEVTCGSCGASGRIEQGAWLPAKDGRRG